jgi:hypothetical protein
MKTSHVLLLVGAALVWAGHARAGANPEAKAAYVEARDAAAATYKAARARCDAITGNPKDQCIADAKAERVRAEEEAAASYANTVKAYTRARLRIASATRPDKTRCAALTGNNKDVCVEVAKATLVAAQADAKLDRNTIEARAQARDDKLTAAYRVALEKCDAFAGAAKDQCVGAAKTAYGK